MVLVQNNQYLFMDSFSDKSDIMCRNQHNILWTLVCNMVVIGWAVTVLWQPKVWPQVFTITKLIGTFSTSQKTATKDHGWQPASQKGCGRWQESPIGILEESGWMDEEQCLWLGTQITTQFQRQWHCSRNLGVIQKTNSLGKLRWKGVSTLMKMWNRGLCNWSN